LFKERCLAGMCGGGERLMKLSRASSYALHAVAFMAAQKKDQAIASHHIAHARGIPERFLLKVLKPLVSAQILHSVKGPNGGFRLARAPGEVSMLEVVEAVDGPIRGTAPMNYDDPKDPLNKRLDQLTTQVADHMRKQLSRVKVSELAVKE
jgi:Rrf2 family protein